MHAQRFADNRKRVWRAEIITPWCFHYRCNIRIRHCIPHFPALASSRIITACFAGRPSRLRKPKYFILRGEARKAFMSRCKGVRVVKGVHGNPRNNSYKTSKRGYVGKSVRQKSSWMGQNAIYRTFAPVQCRFLCLLISPAHTLQTIFG